MILNNRKIKDILLKVNYLLKQFILPPIVYKKLLNLFDSIIFTTKKIFNRKSKLIKDFNKRKRARVFIIANGPSLSSVNILSLINEDIITMNFFIKQW